MFTKRLSYLLIAVALITVAVLTFLEVRSTQALVNQNAEAASRVVDLKYYSLELSNEAANLDRNQAAEAERWAVMGEYYTKQARDIQRSQAAEADRWAAMGDYYTKQALELQRNRAAEAARWNAMGDYYSSAPTTAPVNEAERLQRNRAAEAARWNEMAASYTLK